LTERWLALPAEASGPVKQSLLSTLGTQNRQVGNAVAQCVSAVAMVELPAEKWAELMPALLQFAQDQDNVQLRVSTLVTLGFICEVIVSLASEAIANDRTPRFSQLDQTRS
jgi:importin subunit beta-1